MGFLDRMLSDAIEQSTGFKAKRLVRRIGSRRLLALGGAALAGGMLAQGAQRQGFGGQQRSRGSGGGNVVPAKSSSELRSSRPAPPPAPGSSPLPPLPPTPGSPSPPPPPGAVPPPPTAADSSTAEADRLFEAVALRTVVASALADGQIASGERALLQEHLSASSLDPSEQQKIQGELLSPASPEDLASALPSGEDPTALLALAIAMMRSDGRLCEAEKAWLDRFASALGVSQETVDEIEGELFAAT